MQQDSSSFLTDLSHTQEDNVLEVKTPFIAGRGKELSVFLSRIQQYCKERDYHSLIQCLLRRNNIFVITNDNRLHIGCPYLKDEGNDLLASCGLEKEIGVRKVYHVAAAFCFCLILVDEIIQDSNQVFRVQECNDMYINTLPSGETIRVPKRSSVIAFDLNDGDRSQVMSGTGKTQLNITKTNEVNNAYLLHFDNSFKDNEFITYMACASFSSVFLTNFGRIFVLGSNMNGECGFPKNQEKIEKLTLSKYCIDNPHYFFSKVACGNNNVLAMDNNGLLHATGYNLNGDLGTDSICHSVNTFRRSTLLNQLLETDPALDISSRYNGFIVLTKSGKIYTTGALKIGTIEKPYLSNGSAFNRVLGVGANISSFIIFARQENDLMIGLFGEHYEDEFIFTKENEQVKPLESFVVENGERSLKPGERFAFTSIKSARLLLYIQTCFVEESHLKVNLKNHLDGYVKEGRKSMEDIAIHLIN